MKRDAQEGSLEWLYYPRIHVTRIPAKIKSAKRSARTGASFSGTVQMAGMLAREEQKQLKQTVERKEKVCENNVKGRNEFSLLQFFSSQIWF